MPQSSADSVSELSLGYLIFRRFIALLLLFFVLWLAVGIPAYLQYEKAIKDRLLSHAESTVEGTTQMLKKEMFEQLRVLEMLGNSAAVVNYISSGQEQDRIQLERLMQNISHTYHRFDQIRLLDSSGHELVRVNLEGNEARPVSFEQLQDKSGRYYFNEARRLEPGQVFVSHMDLNVEQGQLELPYKPVLRFATPVVDAEGRTAGVLVLNYLAEDMLASFRTQMSRRQGQQGMLIDAQGYWLSNHERSNEWGDDLGRPEHRFASLYPNAWPVITEQGSGMLENKHGLFRFQKMSSFDFGDAHLPHYVASQGIQLAPVSLSNTDWTLVIFIPDSVIQEHSLLYQPFGRTVLGIMVLFIIGAALLIAITSVQYQARLRHDRRISAELNDLYEHAPCGYHSLDARGYIIRINQTELGWLGYARDEVIGQPFRQFLTEDSRHRFDAFFNALKTDRQIENIVLEMQCKNGSTFYVSISATSLKDSRGHFAMARTSVFDISDRIELEQKLAHQANVDELTGISNRRHFYERGEIELKRALRYQHTLALLMIDADYFKQINDRHGHDGGDVVLKALANSVTGSLRELDVFARFGGEEFIVLLPEISASEAEKVAERLRRQLEQLVIASPTGEQITFTVSVGLAMLEPDDKNLDDLIKRADIALYQAKAQGRNRVVSFNELDSFISS